MTTSITWLGHAGFKIEIPTSSGLKIIFIDPWLTGPTCPEDERTPTQADLILLTHGHFDHAGDAPGLSQRTGAMIAASYELGSWAQGKGATNICQMNKGGTLETDFCSAHLVSADHSGSGPDGGYTGAACGWVINFKDGAPAIYHAGDSNVFGDMRIICDLFAPRIALLPIGGKYTMGPYEAAYASKKLLHSVTTVVPMHYGTIPQLSGTPEQLRTELGKIQDRQDLKVVDLVRSVDCADTLLLSSSLDQSTYLYSQDNDRYSLVQAYQLHQGPVYINKFSPTDSSYFFTGGGDNRAVCSDLEGVNQVAFVGHEGPVSSLDLIAADTLVTGSWDATGKLWDVRTQQCVATMGKEHHSYGVTVLANHGEILTGSQSGKLNFWSQRGEHIRAINAHSDIIREIRPLPNNGFVTCSNDQTVKVWTSDGRLIQTLEGHQGYVFCVEIGPEGVLFSGSDDRTVKMWVNGQCVDTLEMPNSVWGVKFNGSGDVVTACGDKMVRIFTKSQLKIAAQKELEEFREECKAAAAGAQGGGESVDVGKLPNVGDLTKYRGKADGAYKLFKENGVAFAFCWHEDGQYWEKIGEVESQAPSSESSSKQYPGDEVFPQGSYDYIFDVDFGDGRILKLPYNNSQNPLEIAEKFVVREHLHREFLFQIEAFINKNAKPSWNAPQVVTKHEVTAQYFPYNQFLFFDSVSMDPIVKKIVELNGSLSAAIALDAGEIDQLGKLATTLSQKANYRSSAITRKEFLVVNKLLTWPSSHMFPVLDLMRVLQMHPNSAELYKGSEQGAKIVSPAIAMLTQGSGPGLITATRLLCNLFGDNTAMYSVQKRRQMILEAALTHLDTEVKPLRLSLATLVLNYSSLFIQKDDSEGRIQILSAIVDFLQKESEEETLFRGFVTVGNLLSGGGIQPELVELAAGLGMRDLVASKQATATGKAKEIARELAETFYRR